MKILISCYACSPYRGSEPGMGWNFVNVLSREHELHIITEEKFRVDIEQYLGEHPERRDSLRFYFIKRLRLKTLRKIWPPSYYWTYRLWQKKVLNLALRLDEQEHFDVVHQLNMAGYREPGYLWKMERPFVWGPIGGFGMVPWRMIPTMNLWGIVFYTCHNLINSWQMYTKDRVRKAMKKAVALIAATEDTRVAIKKLYGRDSIIISEVGMEERLNVKFCERKAGEKLRLCWSGLHIPRKSLNLLLETLAQISCENIELHVLGEGTETKRWMKLSDKLKLRNIIWHGKLARKDALEVMNSCHLFCITSLSDLTSTVILEALSYGMPVITLDHCGFSNVITPNCGRKIAIHNKKQVVRDFGDAILEIEADEKLRQELAAGALLRAEKYNWPDKGKLITQIYEAVSIQNKKDDMLLS